MNKFTQIVLTAALATTTAAAFAAQQPVRDVGHRHPNLAAAQRLTEKAYQRIVTAQQDNEWDLGGHAAKAKELLDQANQELKAAAETSNQNHM